MSAGELLFEPREVNDLLVLLFMRCQTQIACHNALPKIPKKIKNRADFYHLNWVSFSRVNQPASGTDHPKISVTRGTYPVWVKFMGWRV
jgi:hypothetical protein